MGEVCLTPGCEVVAAMMAQYGNSFKANLNAKPYIHMHSGHGEWSG